MAEVRKSITALYRDFEPAHNGVQEPKTKGNVAVLPQDRTGIVKLPAENIDEMILKIRIALRCSGGLRSSENSSKHRCLEGRRAWRPQAGR